MEQITTIEFTTSGGHKVIKTVSNAAGLTWYLGNVGRVVSFDSHNHPAFQLIRAAARAYGLAYGLDLNSVTGDIGSLVSALIHSAGRKIQPMRYANAGRRVRRRVGDEGTEDEGSDVVEAEDEDSLAGDE